MRFEGIISGARMKSGGKFSALLHATLFLHEILWLVLSLGWALVHIVESKFSMYTITSFLAILMQRASSLQV